MRQEHEDRAEALEKFIWGRDRLKRRRELRKTLLQNPGLIRSFSPSQNVHSLSRRDYWALRVRQDVELLNLKFKYGWSREHFLEAIRFLRQDISSVGVHYRIFIRNLEAQMSPAQKAYWLPKAERMELSGTYAQTELGHGSNVKGIETTATLDIDTDEIVLHSPTISSHKFWIGSLGVVATHAIVVARLIVKSVDLGNHLFLVQVRDLDTHELLSGVTIYEQGEKSMGTFASMDNGTMQFINCRIPRSQMLAGMVSLDRDGTYHGARNSKHAYTSMVIIRGLMTEEIGYDVAKAIVIALKYTTFRKQFNSEESGQEKAVINYASVQHRLFPALSRALAMLLVGRELTSQVKDLTNSDLQSLHLQTVGAKIWVTEHGVRDVEVARLACGGHGHMASAGLGAIYAQLSPSRTYEGDNYVISQQLGNAVLKNWKNGTENAVPALSYLSVCRSHQTSFPQFQCSDSISWLHPHNQKLFLEYRAATLARRHINDSICGKDTSHDVFELAMAHADLTFCQIVHDLVQRGPQDHIDTLSAMINVFALTAMVEGLVALVGNDCLSPSDISFLHQAHEEAIVHFQPYVPVLIDSLGFHELELHSSFAARGQSPYEALWETAKQSTLNDNAFIRPTLLRARNLWREYQDGPRL